MDIKVFNTAAEVSNFVANEIANLVEENPSCSLAVATGRTMDAIYHRLIRLAVASKMDFSEVRAFAVDEYIGLNELSPNSYERYLHLHLFDQLSFSARNLFIPQTNRADLDQACLEFENVIKACEGIDLQLLGVGLNGHIGLNEPGSAHDSRTRVVALTSTTINSNKVLFRKEKIPLTAVTMGIGTILDSKKSFLIATGETKASIIQRIINGDINSQVPATALKSHKNNLVVLDKYAAKLI